MSSKQDRPDVLASCGPPRQRPPLIEHSLGLTSCSVSLQVGLVYMFNLIVGTGALTMPKAFAQAGWAVSLALISFLAFMRRVPRRLTAFPFISTTFALHPLPQLSL